MPPNCHYDDCDTCCTAGHNRWELLHADCSCPWFIHLFMGGCISKHSRISYTRLHHTRESAHLIYTAETHLQFTRTSPGVWSPAQALSAQSFCCTARWSSQRKIHMQQEGTPASNGKQTPWCYGCSQPPWWQQGTLLGGFLVLWWSV